MMAADSLVEELLKRGRIGQFLSVGVLGALIETVFVALFTGLLGAGALVAKAVGAEASISTMFVANDRWTFAGDGERGLGPTVRRWGRSHAVRLVGLSVGFAVLYILTTFTTVSVVLADIDFWPTLANGLGIGCGMVINYIAESVFTWDVLAEVSEDV